MMEKRAAPNFLYFAAHTTETNVNTSGLYFFAAQEHKSEIYCGKQTLTFRI
jgi:hypothetical protein